LCGLRADLVSPAARLLLAGRPLDLMRRHARPFFFDLGGRLAERFALRATPTLMTRAGAQLRLAEIPLAGPRCAPPAPAGAGASGQANERKPPC